MVWSKAVLVFIEEIVAVDEVHHSVVDQLFEYLGDVRQHGYWAVVGRQFFLSSFEDRRYFYYFQFSWEDVLWMQRLMRWVRRRDS